MRLGHFLSVPLLMLLLSGCTGVDYDANVSTAIATQVQQNKMPIKIADLTDFKWEKLHVFTPYTPQKSVDRALGFHWQDYQSTGLIASDQFCLLVFVANGKVIKVSEYPVNKGTFAPKSTDGYLPNQALFEITKQSSGVPILRPIERYRIP
jgi:hypothetical protein